MNKDNRRAYLVFILLFSAVLFVPAYAEEKARLSQEVKSVAEGAAETLSIKSDKPDNEVALKNPFRHYKPHKIEMPEVKQDAVSIEQIPVESAQTFDYSSLTVTGLVWGDGKARAIINDRVVGIGDTIDEITIINITKEGILFEYKGREYLMKRGGMEDVKTDEASQGNAGKKSSVMSGSAMSSQHSSVLGRGAQTQPANF